MQFHFQKAVDIFLKTIPFVILRLGVYVLVMGGTLLWFAGIFFLFRHWPFPGPPWLAWVVGGLLFGQAFKLVREYLLYLLKAAHVAVITRLAVQGSLPEGRGQLAYGFQLLFRHFVKVSLLFAVDRLVNVILRAFNRSVFRLLSFVPGLGGMRNFFQRVLDYSAGYVDEAILSYSLLQPSRNPWGAARDGLVLYAQNWRTILGSGLVLALISYILVGVVAVPGALLALAAGFSPTLGWGLAAGMGLLLKFAVMDPFALTSVIVNFHAAIADQQPDPHWDEELEKVSSKFKEIKRLAGEWKPSGPAGTAPATPSGTPPLQID